VTQTEINCGGGPELQDLLKRSILSAGSPYMHTVLV